MAETSGEALREIADMIDGLRDACAITARSELTAMVDRLRILAEREHPLTENYDEETVGECDHCGSRLVFRGRNPSVLTCPLGCQETGP